MKKRVEKLEKDSGGKETILCFGCGYNEENEILYEAVNILHGKNDHNVYTEKQMKAAYPTDLYELRFKVFGVSNGKGGDKLDDKGRPEIVDFRDIYV